MFQQIGLRGKRLLIRGVKGDKNTDMGLGISIGNINKKEQANNLLTTF